MDALTFMIPVILAESTLMYLYLHHKTRMNKKFIFLDNLIVIFFVILIFYFLTGILNPVWSIILSIALVPIIGFCITMIRFWRTPKRKIPEGENIIVSPADGNIIYIKEIKDKSLLVSVKGKTISKLDELTKTDILKYPCKLIGINMTPFDVHKNCAPIDGKVTFYKHTPGKFLSLKEPDSETDNERATYIFQNSKITIGVIQIASKLVRRIDNYINVGDLIKKGDWIGMIRFGSQVDVILPLNTKIKVTIGEQVYAQKTVIAEMAEN